MKSRIYWGQTDHWRGVPRPFSFSYKLFTFGVALDEIESICEKSRLFRHNRRGLFSIRDEDYLGRSKDPLSQKLRAALLPHCDPDTISSTLLVTMPKYFGYIFNPVSFFISRLVDGSLHSVLIEVNNTFGETHLYPLIPTTPVPPNESASFTFDKEFFVSPFYDVSGEYRFTVGPDTDDLNLRVDLIRNGTHEFSATLCGKGEPLSRSRIVKTILQFPITSFLTMPRIHRQALGLYAKVGVTPFQKPEPTHPQTICAFHRPIHYARLRLLDLLRWRRRSAA